MAKYFLDTTKSLGVLTARPLKKNPTAASVMDLPSWAPDWTVPADETCNFVSLGIFSSFYVRSLILVQSQARKRPANEGSIGTPIFKAGLEVSANYPHSFSCFDEIFNVYGLAVDRIASVFRLVDENAAIKSTIRDLGALKPQDLVENLELMRDTNKSLYAGCCDILWNVCHEYWGDIYGHTGQPLQDAFWRTVFLDRFHDSHASPPTLARIPEFSGPTTASDLFNDPEAEDCKFPPQTQQDREGVLEYMVSQAGYGLQVYNTDFYGLDFPFFITTNGYIGVCHPDAAVGDVVAVLRGGSVPYILRGYSQSHVMVGEWYVLSHSLALHTLS